MQLSTRDLLPDFDVRQVLVAGGVGNFRRILQADAMRFGVMFITSPAGGWDVRPRDTTASWNSFRIAAANSIRFNFRDDGPIVCMEWSGNWTGFASDLAIIETVYKPVR